MQLVAIKNDFINRRKKVTSECADLTAVKTSLIVGLGVFSGGWVVSY